MLKQRPGSHGPSRAVVRRALFFVCLTVFASLTLLPLFLMLTGLSEPCEEHPTHSPSWLEAGNPFSHYNLCRMKLSVSGTSLRDVPAPGRPSKQTIPIHSHSDGHHPAPAAPPQPVHGTHTISPASTGTAGAHTQSTPAASPPPPSPSPPPLSASGQDGQHHKHIHEDDIDDIEMPVTDEDFERILRLPHHTECNACKVCVPYSVVSHLPKAQNHPYHKAKYYVPTTDDDVLLDSFSVQAATNAAKGVGLQDGEEEDLIDPDVDEDQGKKRKLMGMWAGEGASGVRGEQGPEGHGVSGKAGRRLMAEKKEDDSEANSLYHVQGKVIDIKNIAPGDTRRKARAHLPNCTACWGCSHTLEMMAMGTVMAGSYYAHEPGGSPSWLFRVRTNRTRSGWAVVKLWCVPVRKAKQRGLAMCTAPKVFAQIKLLLAQNKVIRQCGLDSIVPTLWVEPVMGVIPGHGFRIDWLGLWADIADGTSVQNIQEFGNPRTNPEYMLDLFTTKLNHTEIKLIAIFDVLFSQCDRHQQNIFVTEKGKVWAIDNDQVFSVAWRKCGFDSMLLPTTQKFMINHLGFFYVLKYPQKDPPKMWTHLLNPLLLLDYRCHVEHGAIGFNYPPKLMQCMKAISAMTPLQVQDKYGYSNIKMADAIRNRSRDLSQQGFEWTLLHGQPTNLPNHRYKVAPSCCSMTYNPKNKKYTCNTPWTQMTEIPYGNPWHGGAWHGAAGKDTGSYEGGTSFTPNMTAKTNPKPTKTL